MDDHSAVIGGTILFTIIIVVFSLLATIVPMVLIFRWIGKMKGQNQALLNTGIPAQARIVQVGHTGMTINHVPQLNIVLEVQPQMSPGFQGTSAPYTVNVQALIPVFAMGRIQPGSMVPVRFAAHNPSQVAIDLRAMGFV
jgi:hypothetical protein